MKNEIAAAVVFITRMIKSKGNLTKEQLNTFSDKLTVALAKKYRNHWYEESPSRGQAYRCLRVSPNVPQEPMLKTVAKNANLEYTQLCLPEEMVLWVDPGEVACRFGDRGSTFLVSSSKKDVTSNINTNESQNGIQKRVAGGYVYTKYSKQPVNNSHQAKDQHQAHNQYRYQDQYKAYNQNRYQQDQYQAQDQYHWHNVYNTQIAVA
ncbi:protein BTG3-like [Anneissia japonica]|uniref:protein BTG3-like n=1 Tax=Anneissia japonica TaxID=1529436 RepID=UPI001425B261|nr:protein BTG3-like [Anneissia japonica]